MTTTTPAGRPGLGGPSVNGIVDVDVHESFRSLLDLVPYLSNPWRDLVARGNFRGFPQPFLYWGTGGGDRLDAKPSSGAPAGSDYPLLAEQLLDAYPISHAILTGYFFPAMFKMQYEFASALAAAYNDWQIEHWLDKDTRLLGSIHVAPQQPEVAAREIDRCGVHPRMVQVLLPICQWAYGEPQYHPIFAAAERHGLVVAFHHTTQVQGALGMGMYSAERHMLIPQATMAEVISLLCNGVFDKFPNLKFVFLEGGFSWLPHVLWRCDREYRSFQQEIPWVQRKPSEHIRSRVRFSTQPSEDLTLTDWTRLMDLIGDGDDLLLFSTDYPHFDFDSPADSLPRGLSVATVQKILVENARMLYGL